MAGYRREIMIVAVSSMDKFSKTGHVAVSSYSGGGSKETYRTSEELSAAIKNALKSGVNVDIVAPKGAAGELFKDMLQKEFPKAIRYEGGPMTEVYISGVPKPKIVSSTPARGHRAPAIVRELAPEEPSYGHRAPPPVIVSAEEPGVLAAAARFIRDLGAAYRKGRPARAPTA